ncbi:MAG: DUF3592 domain-containing protein [Anaerolineales bacterium]|nr:MAG: DUF3592 domain-containing protein [Anaerolineales bacterium]
MQTKTSSKLNKAFDSFDKLYRGCVLIGVNLFVLLFLCWSLYKGFVGFRVESNGDTTEGTVVRYEERDGGTVKAVISFDVNGESYTFTDDVASRPPRFELGEIVTVRYDRSNPNIAQIDDSPFPLWLFPSCWVAGLFVALIGVNIWGWRAWKRGEEML